LRVLWHGSAANILACKNLARILCSKTILLHAELATFLAAGLTPYGAIRAGTSDAARFLHRETEFGSVAVGYRADL
jgi:imidazolonepropionase-like amidohydrolase